MLPISKFDMVIGNLTAAAAATHLNGMVDMVGYNFATINFAANLNHTTAASHPTQFKLGQSDDTYITNATDIAAFVGSVGATTTSAGWSIPDMPTVTTVPYTVQMNVDARALSRYLFLEITPAGGNMTGSAFASLFRADQLPNTVAEAGVLALANG